MLRMLLVGALLPTSVALAYLILKRPIREIREELDFERARRKFRRHREWLEVQFLHAMKHQEPEELARWEEADWLRDVSWARDRNSRVLHALAAVKFPDPPFTDSPPHHASAVFEYRRGRWTTQGDWIDELRPNEAVLAARRFEPIIILPRRPSQAGGTMN